MRKPVKYRIIEIPTKTSPYYIVEEQKSFLWIKYWEEVEREYDKGSRTEPATFSTIATAEEFVRKQAVIRQQRRKVVKQLEL